MYRRILKPTPSPLPFSPATALVANLWYFGTQFSHVVQTEPNYDGGVVFYSVNGDNATLVPFDFFSTNGYNGYLAGLDFGGDNPLAAVSEVLSVGEGEGGG